MNNFLCKTIMEMPRYMFSNVVIPEGVEMFAGSVCVTEKLADERVDKNLSTYIPEPPGDVSNQDISLVLNNGFETLANGRRPEGQPDYTQYAYGAGEVVTCIKLNPEIRLEISLDCIDNPNDLISLMEHLQQECFLVPENDYGVLVAVNNVDLEKSLSKTYLVVEQLKKVRLGGLFGEDYVYSVIVRVKKKAKENKPETYQTGDILTAKLADHPTDYITRSLGIKQEGAPNQEIYIIGNSFEHLGSNDYNHIETMCCFGYARGEDYSGLGTNGDAIYFYCNQAMIDVFGEESLSNISGSWFNGDGWYKYYDDSQRLGINNYKVEKQVKTPSVNFSIYKFNIEGTNENEMDVPFFNDAFLDLFETITIKKSPLDTLVISAGTIVAGNGQIPSGRTVATLEKVNPEITYGIDFIDGDNDNQYFEINSQSRLIVAKDNVPSQNIYPARYFNIQVKVTDETNGIESPNNVVVGEASSVA